MTLFGYDGAGLSSLFSMPVSLVCATLFSESMWQRVWAAEAPKARLHAAWMAAVSVAVVVFFFGFAGFLALWSGRVPPDTDPNLLFFSIFNEPDQPVELRNVPGLLAFLCAAVMSEGATDSLQNGIVATLASTLLKGRPLWTARALVVVVNVPLAVLGCIKGLTSVLDLFLLANLLATCFAVPVFCTMLSGVRMSRLLTEGAVLLSIVFGASGLTCFGWDQAGLAEGAKLAWMGNQYGAEYFVVTLVASCAGLALGVAVGVAARNAGVHAVGIRRCLLAGPLAAGAEVQANGGAIDELLVRSKADMPVAMFKVGSRADRRDDPSGS